MKRFFRKLLLMLIIVGMLGQSIYAWGNRPENIRENNKLTYFEENFDLYGVRKGKDIDITGMIKFGSKASNWNTLPERFDIPLNKPWKSSGDKASPLTKVPGTTRLLSKLANEIKKDPNGGIQRGSFFMHKTKDWRLIINSKICIVFYIE